MRGTRTRLTHVQGQTKSGQLEAGVGGSKEECVQRKRSSQEEENGERRISTTHGDTRAD